MTNTQDFPSSSLRGMQLRITLAQVERDTVTGRVVRGAGVEDAWLLFDNNTLAALEESFGSISAWRDSLSGGIDPHEVGEAAKAEGIEADEARAEQFMRGKPFTAIRNTLACALERDPKLVGAAMLPAEFGDYGDKIMLGFALANGVDPTLAGQALQMRDAEGMSLQDAMVKLGIAEGTSDEKQDDDGTQSSAPSEPGPPLPTA